MFGIFLYDCDSCSWCFDNRVCLVLFKPCAVYLYLIFVFHSNLYLQKIFQRTVTMNKPRPLYWTRDAIKMLINLYESYPCLCDVQSPLDHNTEAHRDALLRITKELQKVRPGTTEADVKEKYESLRVQYHYELRKVNASKSKTGSRTIGLYTPKLWCFNKLHFLKDHVKPGKDALVGSDLDDQEEEEEMIKFLEDYPEEQQSQDEGENSETIVSPTPVPSRAGMQGSPSSSIESSISSQVSQNQELQGAEGYREAIASPEPGCTFNYLQRDSRSNAPDRFQGSKCSTSSIKSTASKRFSCSVVCTSNKKAPREPMDPVRQYAMQTLEKFTNKEVPHKDDCDNFGQFIAICLRGITNLVERKKLENKIFNLIISADGASM